MSTKMITTCDVPPCTKTKGEGNHWLQFYLTEDHTFCVRPLEFVKYTGSHVKDCCSQECLMCALSQWLEKQRNAEREIGSK